VGEKRGGSSMMIEVGNFGVKWDDSFIDAFDVWPRTKRKGKMSERKVNWGGRKDWYELNKAYETLGNAINFKVGDKVRILRKADTFELGWCCDWSSKMDKYIGKIVEIDKVFPCGCIKIDGYFFPWFVLELVEPVSEKHTITIDGKSTEVDDKTYQKVKNLFD
jgi:hypothetical protein